MPRNADSLRSEVMSTRRKEHRQAVTAAALNIGKLPSMERRLRDSVTQTEAWQEDAWRWYDQILEYRFAVDWVGNLLSKAKLVITKDGKPVTDKKILASLDELFGGAGGHSEMLRQCGIHFTVGGESYIVQGVREGGSREQYFVASGADIQEPVDPAGTKWTIDKDVYDGPILVKIWRPHPRKWKTPNSPSRAALPVLAEIYKLSQHIDAQLESRLAGAGILLLPTEVDYAGIPTSDPDNPNSDGIVSTGARGIIQKLAEAMETAIADRGNPSALVPIVLQVAGEYVEKIKHLTFWSDLDKESNNMRDRAIHRLALGMDMPPEVLTGTGGLNHWASWQVEEASIKAHTEPLLAIITSSLTDGYLQPWLEDFGMDPEKASAYRIEADTSAMRLRPNRSEEAFQLYDRGLINREALLRENGFDVLGDAMPDDEFAKWFLRKIASGSTTPDLVEAAIRQLGINLGELESTVVENDTQEARPNPSLKDIPKRELPEEDSQDALVAAATEMVHRALERAGNRLRTKMGRKVPAVAAADTYKFVEIREEELDDLLTDCWSVCERASEYGMRPETLTMKLDAYSRELLLTREPHSKARLQSYMDTVK